MCRNKRLACGCKEASRQDKNIVIFEFSQFTPAGQDFFFSATMQGRSLESLVSDMEEAGQQRTRQKRHTLPMKDVLADMEAADGMVSKLLEAVRGLTN